MGYQLIEDFKFGLDVRKHPIAAPAGTLLRLNNAHLTRGAEIEKRQAFVPLLDLTDHFPAGSIAGMHATPDTVWLFGQVADPGNLPAPFVYQQITPPGDLTNAVLRYVKCVEFVGNQPFVVATWEATETGDPPSDPGDSPNPPDPSGGTGGAGMTITLTPPNLGETTTDLAAHTVGQVQVAVSGNTGTVTYEWNYKAPQPVNYGGGAVHEISGPTNAAVATFGFTGGVDAGDYTTRFYGRVSDANTTTTFELAVRSRLLLEV